MEEGQKTHVLGRMRGLIAVGILTIALFVTIFGNWNRVDVQNAETASSTKPLQILFVGDIMLDRTVRNTIAAHGFDHSFGKITSIFEDVDLAVGNLEGTITENSSKSVKDLSVLKFTFATSSALDLQRLGFTHVSLANNHSLDFGQDGFSDTEKYLEKAGVNFFGSPNNDRGLSSDTITQGKHICLVGYHQLFIASTVSVIREINNLRPHCDYLTVFAHWGVEYQSTSTEAQKRIGHAFIDAGADLVIGSHPHVIEPVEIYNNHAIFYSLGNFIFDQDFSLPTRQGLAIRLELSSTTEKFHLIGLEMSQSALYFPEKERFRASLDTLISELPPVHKTLADVDGVLILKRGK